MPKLAFHGLDIQAPYDSSQHLYAVSMKRTEVHLLEPVGKDGISIEMVLLFTFLARSPSSKAIASYKQMVVSKIFLFF